MKFLIVVLSIAVAAAWIGVQPTLAEEPQFTGIDGCTKSCHKKEDEGDQKSIWMKSKHAKAYKSLGTDEAKKAAAEVGMSGDPQKSENCLVCHTTGYGLPEARFDKKFSIDDGVQCEACHGPGENYRKKKSMKKIAEERGPDGKGKSATAAELGLIFPTEKECKVCHSQQISWQGKTFKNPKFKAFDFDKMYDKIKHPVPKS